MKLNGTDVRGAMQALNVYYLDGQIQYEAIKDGKTYATPLLEQRPEAFGLSEADKEKIKKYEMVGYVIDFIFQNADQLDQLNVIIGTASTLGEAVRDLLTKKVKHGKLLSTEAYRIQILPQDSIDQEKETAGMNFGRVLPRIGKAEFLHVGIPIVTRKPGMTWLDQFKIWVSDTDDYDFKFEYIKYEEGTVFPGILHKNPHIAYMVNDMQPYLDAAEEVIFPPTPLVGDIQFCYILVDNTIIELQAHVK